MKRSVSRGGLVGLFILVSQAVFSLSDLGTGRTIDDMSGSAKSILEVYEKGNGIYGRIKRILVKGKENALCINCEDKLRDKLVVGMLIINGLKNSSKNEYDGGEILDRENGRKNRYKIWLNPENPKELKVRGYVAFFYRTQTWLSVNKYKV